MPSKNTVSSSCSPNLRCKPIKQLMLLISCLLATSAVATLATADTIRINTGGSEYIDTIGNTWSADQHYSGGSSYSTSMSINGTSDDPLYQSERWGNSFSYDIPIANGQYNLIIHAAEIYFNNANTRVFSVNSEGAPVFTNLDIWMSHGQFTAASFSTTVDVTDGSLTLDFYSSINNAKISAIEILPVANTIRINTGGLEYIDIIGNTWSADQHYSGGSSYSTSISIDGTSNDPLYQSERWGNSFSYDIPIANGQYNLIIHAAEIYFDSANARVFSVNSEGAPVFANLDIWMSHGQFTAASYSTTVDVTDESLTLDFYSSINNAKISAIEILPTSGPRVLLTPTSYDFGSIDIGTSTNSSGIELINNTNAVVQIDSMSLTGSNADHYQVLNTLPLTLSAGESSEVSIAFTPLTFGNQTATLEVLVQGQGYLNIALQGQTTAQPEDAITRINCGGAAYIDNTGNHWSADTDYNGGRIYSTSAAVSGTPNSELYQSERWGNGFSYSIPVTNGTFEVELHFAEVYFENTGDRVFSVNIEGTTSIADLDLITTAGLHTAYTHTVITTVSDGFLDVVFNPSVDNAKISAIEIFPASFKVEPKSINFGTIALNVSPETQSFDLINNTTSPISILSVVSQGANASEFTVDRPEPFTVQPISTETIQVTLTPITEGLKNAQIVISSDSPDSPHQVVVFGTAIPEFVGPIVSLSTSDIDFGTVLIAGIPQQQTLTIQNTGDQTLVVSSLSLSGSHAGDFTIDTSGATITPGSQEIITISFSPQAEGLRSASLSIDSNTSESPHTVSLLGTGEQGDPLPALVRINSGGGMYVDLQGNTWEADSYYTNGDSFSVSNPIANTLDDTIYQSERWGLFEYHIPVTNGVYQLRLHFVETYVGGTESRVFGINVEDAPVVTNLNIIAEAGELSALVKEAVVEVLDGSLDIVAIQEIENPKISGIEVLNGGLFVSPLSHSFDFVPIGQTSSPLSIELTNYLDSPVTINSIHLEGLGASTFSIDDMSPRTLSAGQSDYLTAWFTPTSSGNSFANLVIETDTPQLDKVVALSGSSAGITLDLWYGDSLTVGNIGIPQRWMNILGNISAETIGIASLEYQLNGGLSMPLSIGPNGSRLAGAGDFNVEIGYLDLLPGNNDVLITATAPSGFSQSRLATVNYVTGNEWPRDYSIDWTTVGNINDVASVVDGHWTLQDDKVRVVQSGYDRLIAIGDINWTDYELTVPVVAYAVYGQGLIGSLFRWDGHYDWDGEAVQPRRGWNPMGAFGYYEFGTPSGLKIMRNTGGIVEHDPNIQLQLNQLYMFKMRVETIPNVGGLYSVKIWEAESPEPLDWTLQRQESLSDPQRGSLLLVAHEIDAAFGKVQITQITDSIAPEISNLGATSGAFSALIECNTNEPAKAWVFYGQTPALELGSLEQPNFETAQQINITGLLPDSTYYYEVHVEDPNGNSTVSTVNTFITFSDPGPQSSGIRINCGGTQYIDTLGKTWNADQYSSGGQAFITNGEIVGTDDDTLYLSERWGSLVTYNIPVSPGDYQVILHFAEIYFFDLGQRVFSISLEDQVLEPNFDIIQAAGSRATSVQQSFDITVSDTMLNIDLSSIIDNAKISAIEINEGLD